MPNLPVDGADSLETDLMTEELGDVIESNLNNVGVTGMGRTP